MAKNASLEPDNATNSKTSRRSFLVVSATAGVGLAGALVRRSISNAQEQNAPPQSADNNRVLIVYSSRTENTQAVAEIIQQEVGGDLFEVETAEPYPVVYDELVAQVDKENETGYTPALKCKVENFQAYDSVFFGFPTWDMQLPPQMKSFLQVYDLSGKTVIPFNTNGGYGVGSSFREIEDSCPDSNILKGYSTRGGSETDGIYLAIKGERREEVHAEVTDWLRRIQARP